jgi:phage baseplate assembly protein W
LRDIAFMEQGEDLDLRDSDAMKGANVVSTQLGRLHFLPDFGCDMEQFIFSPQEYSIQSYKAYCVQRLVESKVSLQGISEAITLLDGELQYSFGTGEATL